MLKKKFKPGDRVVCVNTSNVHGLIKNKTYTIVRVLKIGNILLVDKPILYSPVRFELADNPILYPTLRRNYQ